MKPHVCAVLVTAALAGCGTGGGGGSGPSDPVSPPPTSSPPESSPPESSPPESDPPESSRPPSSEFPTLSTVRDELRVSSAITSRPHEHFRGVVATADGAGNVTFRVNDPNVGPYTFTVNLPPNSSLNVSNETIEGTFTSLRYSSAGVWASKIHPQTTFSGPVAGAAAVGVPTPRANLPTTGTAQYSGQFLGRQDSDGINQGSVRAGAQSVANFGSGIVSFTTTNSVLNWGTGDLAAPELDLTGSMTFLSSGGVRQNSVSGPVSTRHGMTGEVRGNFFGPSSASSAPPELAGSVAVKLPGSAPDREGRSMIGAFVMKR